VGFLGYVLDLFEKRAEGQSGKLARRKLDGGERGLRVLADGEVVEANADRG
jgi:hypothetical protein